jgi:hypothetical protein
MMRNATFIFAVTFLVVLASTTGAQNAPPVGRAPEYEKLTYFVGNWKTDGEIKPGPYSPGGTFVSNDHAEWMDGGRFVIGRAMSTTPNGKQFQLSILGYDARRKAYTFNSFNSAGIQTSALGTLNDQTWTWTSVETVGAQTLHSKHTITMLSPSAYTARFEISTDGVTWSSFMEGRVTKVD